MTGLKTGLFSAFPLVVALTILGSSVFAQKADKTPAPVKHTIAPAAFLTSSPAYAELLLRRTEIESKLESLSMDYTDDHPGVRSARAELNSLRKEMARLSVVKVEDAQKLTLALGKLMVKKAEIGAELELLLEQYKDEHPDVRRAKRRLETYEAAIKEILG